jgi:hypothetical protein
MLALMLLAAASASPAPQPKGTSFPAGAAVIINSGSTNTAPYHIVVLPDGTARIEMKAVDTVTKTLSPATVKAFFADIRAAMPLDVIKTEPCMKSASFGTSTFVRYEGKQSPDLGCSSGSAAERLGADVEKITAELGVNALRSFGTHPVHAIQGSPPTPFA